ncbi:phosphatase PAP2 family protein [Alteromonas sp. 14N.309.X.WAT.G.H12]|uniref:phosphatase PAP2 family protein n=1 Tax=Alteromonas sp. 14N.309.X.WAT.G.H12 TaxID=3120824 RepID=UPI002FD0D322
MHPRFSVKQICLFAAMGIAVFIVITLMVNNAMTTGFDTWGLGLFRQGSESTYPQWLAVHFRDITTLGSNWWIIFIGVVSGLILRNLGYSSLATFIVLSIGGGILMSFALKYGFQRPRPDLLAHETKVYTSSFPSGHAMVSALAYLALVYVVSCVSHNKGVTGILALAATLIVLFVGISRVFLAVHWPTDIIAGWVAGATWFFICCALFKTRQQG